MTSRSYAELRFYLTIKIADCNVRHDLHADVRALEQVGLLERGAKGELQVPWDVIDAHMKLVA